MDLMIANKLLNCVFCLNFLPMKVTVKNRKGVVLLQDFECKSEDAKVAEIQHAISSACTAISNTS